MTTAALSWFARHEIRLAWREWLAIMTGGRRGRRRAVIIGLLVFGALLHVPAYAVIGRYATLQETPDKSTLIVLDEIWMADFARFATILSIHSASLCAGISTVTLTLPTLPCWLG